MVLTCEERRGRRGLVRPSSRRTRKRATKAVQRGGPTTTGDGVGSRRRSFGRRGRDDVEASDEVEVDGGVAPAIVAGDGGSVPRSRTSTEGEGIGLDPDPARVGKNERNVGEWGSWARVTGEWGYTAGVCRLGRVGGQLGLLAQLARGVLFCF